MPRTLTLEKIRTERDGGQRLPARNYRVVANCLAQLAAFHHSTMSGRWETIDENATAYVVYSYRTPIAWVVQATTTILANGVVGGTTTTKHLYHCRVNLPQRGWAELLDKAER